MDAPGRSRRDFLTGAAALAALGAPGVGLGLGGREAPDEPVGDAGRQDGITVTTIAEAEKLYGVRSTPAQRSGLLASLSAQVAGAGLVRAVPRDLALAPALTFDPRLPGVDYPVQDNRLTLSRHQSGPLPGDAAAIADASVREQGGWIRARQLTSRRLTEIYLDRIDRLAGSLFCYITVTPELALQ
jgi:hypothetical protein